MNYRHLYHAGNFADVFKHIILIALVRALQQKEKGFCYLETHAGSGLYDLHSPAAQKNKEYEEGVGKLFLEKNSSPIITDYLTCLTQLNPTELHYYPGSPFLVNTFLRPQDRMVLCELQPDEYLNLKKLFFRNNNIAIHHQNGYEGLKAFLPPKEKRGLILIDPPYEKQDEMLQLTMGLKRALTQFKTGIYAIWYPIKHTSAPLLQSVQKTIDCPALFAELLLYPENSPYFLKGCGMILLNPPWKINEQIQAVTQWLLEKLGQKSATFHGGFLC